MSHRDRKKAFTGRGTCNTIEEDSLPDSPRGERTKASHVTDKVKGAVSPRQQ